MPTDLPIACSLTADELPARLADMEAIGRDALLAVVTSGRRATLRFRSRAATRERLAAIVAAESQCCAFLKFGLVDAGDALVLSIDAPPGAEPVLDDLVAAFDHGRRAA
jgi:hypothetical protein